eukprot:m.88894 g.88894  ORF g.88894 m.88894 type:complete len:572 (-) comp14556_c2_seq1:217-1932(-)
MRITPDGFADAFVAVRTRELGDGCAVLILVAADTDALCAYHMVKDLLRSEYIKYKMITVANYEDLENTKTTIRDSDGQIKVVFMINCGGTVDLAETLDLTEEEQSELCLCVIDSHRPLNLDNIYSEHILVFDDGETDIPSPEEVNISDEEEEDEEDDDDLDDDARRAKRAKTADKLAERVEKRNRLQNYYASGSYGISSAVLVGDLVSKLGKSNNSYLWFSAVGLTDQYLHDKISNDAYVQHALNLQSDVLRFNSEEEAQRHRGVTLTVQEDAKFFLLRHWSLYDAMTHARYVVARIPVWTNKGEERLRNLFATMGVSLQECKQVYRTLSADTKTRILDQLKECGEAYGLDKVTFLSFTFQTAYQPAVSAADVVYAVNGILNHVGQPYSFEDKVFKALDCLTMKHQEAFDFGIQCAKEQETAIMNQVQYAFQDDSAPKQRWHLAMVRTESQRFFENPAMLIKLAQYLTDIRRFSTMKAYRLRQQIVAIHNDNEDTTTYVGVWCKPKQREGTVAPNRFASIFPSVAEACNVEYRVSEFESNVIQVLKEYHGRFVLALMKEIIRISRDQQAAA